MKKKGKHKKLWIALLVLAVLTPLGLWVPNFFGAGGAWGEWGWREIEKMLGYAPSGLKKTNGLWKAPVAGYGSGYLGYLASALLGILVIAVVVFAVSRIFLSGRNRKDNGQKDGRKK
ncbi:MAG: hypothetical protein M0Z61_13435 [Nitrospiraceae bacterium]|nr:hypothetical protein [Nitrospiraceae bacterium]